MVGSSMKFTIVGGNGFIGSKVAEIVKKNGHKVFIPKRGDQKLYTDELGIVIYCSGVGECQNRPFDVLDANTTLLSRILKESKFERLIYLSSNRLYMGGISSIETDDLIVLSQDQRRLFNLTKMVSEELCLLSGRDITIVRPSNVYGLALDSPLFLPSIIKDAINLETVNMYVEPEYSKDYVSVDDVSKAIYKLALKNDLGSKVYNICSGENVTAEEIADILVRETKCDVIWHKTNNSVELFPVSNISSLSKEIDFQPSKVLNDLKAMIDDYKNNIK